MTRVQLGTFLFVLVGCGAQASDARPDGGLGDGDFPDVGSRVDGATADGAVSGEDAALDGSAADAATSDAATPPPTGDVPGGPPGTAPVVGCADAERPARASPSTPAGLCEAVPPARCWYVAIDGHDDAAGTFADPLLRPQQAVRGAGPGDVIYLRGGVYGRAHSYVVAAQAWGDPSRGVVRRLLQLGRVQTPAWSTNESWATPNGTSSAPITVRSYPGERACADGTGGIGIGTSGADTHDWNIEDLTVRGNAVLVAGGARGPSGAPIEQTHHVVLRRSEIYAVTGPRSANIGLVRIDRGDWGGPAEITLESNILHDLSVDEGAAGVLDWRTTTDAQHFGAVTTLSCESYVMPFGGCGGNGRLVIRNNLIHDVPSAFFFKNPTTGPVEVSENTIHDVRMLGQWSPSNLTFEHNTVWAARGGAHVGGFGGDTSPPVAMIAGRHFVARFNTLVGMTTVFTFDVHGDGQTVTDNVVVGLNSDASMASYNTSGYSSRSGAEAGFPDTGCMPADLGASELAASTFDRECFVTTHPRFIALSRYCPTPSGWNIAWLTLDEARATFGHHGASVVQADPHSVFVDYDAGDYRVRASGPCGGRGARSDAP